MTEQDLKTGIFGFIMVIVIFLGMLYISKTKWYCEGNFREGFYDNGTCYYLGSDGKLDSFK